MCSWDVQNFLLIRKTHPEWQKGKLNGIGGKIEKKEKLTSNGIVDHWLLETPFEAMIREFHEETGITTTRERWHCFHIKQLEIPLEPGIDGDESPVENVRIYYFAAFGDEAKRQYIGENKDPLFEMVSSYTLIDLLFHPKESMVYDLGYLISMIIENIKNGTFKQLNPQGVNNIP